MRVYQLAKELGYDSKEFVKKLKELKVPVKNHLSNIDEDTVEIVRHEIEELKEKEIQANVVETEFPLTVKDFSVKIGKKPSEVITMLLKKGKATNINQKVEKEVAVNLARDLGITLKEKSTLEDSLVQESPLDETRLKSRLPIVTLMGHIDHGKTTILDYIRKSRVAAKESGSITQHIGGYQISVPKGKITFIDTPGHQTFTSMRARGANVTDIVVLVVAADEGVKPQTEEAISHAKAASVPIVIAMNKIDKPNTQPDMVKQQLSKLDLTPEDWGGNTIVVSVSGKTGEGIDKLLDSIYLESEMLELKADFDRPAVAIVLESELSKGLGAVATVVIKQGILNLKDSIVCGESWGRIKSIKDDRGNSVFKAYPADPVEISGLEEVVSAGDKLFVVPSDKEAADISEKRKTENKEKAATPTSSHVRLEDIYSRMKENQQKQFNIIIKADTDGTLEAISDIIQKIDLKEVEIKIIHKSIGVINRSDVILAEASDALIMGFKVGVSSAVEEQAKEKGVQIKTYQVIYALISDIKAALEGLLEPVIKREFVGRAKVKKVFKVSKAGIIAGSIVEKGKILRNSMCKVTRDGKTIFEGKIKSLKRFKNDVREVGEGVECGIDVGEKDIKSGDVIEAFREESSVRKIEI